MLDENKREGGRFLRFRDAIQRRSDWIVVCAFLAQAAILVLASWRSSTEILIIACVMLLVGVTVQALWRKQVRFPGLGMIIVPLAFGGLGMALGQTWFETLSYEEGPTGGEPGWTRRGLVLSGMLILCLPACVALCSYEECGGRRRSIIRRIIVLHLIMLLGMIATPWLLARLFGEIEGGLARHSAGLSGMAFGAIVAVVGMRGTSRFRRRTSRGSVLSDNAARVLLIEDSNEVRRFLSSALAREGHNVIESSTIEAAEEALGTVDIVITDVELPGESGWALAERLRGEEPELPIVVMSGNPERLLPNALGVPTFQKPFRIACFLSTVRELVEDRGSA